MSLRTRLIIAFFALSVVPLGAVTLYTYVSNAEALRDAAQREADLLAGELGQRMQLVTAQLSERVEHLMDIAELQAEVEARATEPEPLAPVEPVRVVTLAEVDPAAALTSQVAKSLGEAAVLLNNVELQGLRSGWRGTGGGRAPARTEPGTAVRSPGSRGGGAAGTGTPGRPPGDSRRMAADAPKGAGSEGPRFTDANRPPPPSRVGPTPGAPNTPAGPPAAVTPGGAKAVTPQIPAPPQTPGVSAPPPVSPPAPADRFLIDMAPIRRDMYREILDDARIENLSPEQRQRLADEVNQRLLGIAQGIKLGAAELQKRALAAQQAQAQKQTEAAAFGANAKVGAKIAAQTSAAAPTGPPKPPAAPAQAVGGSRTLVTTSASPLKRSSSLKGNRIDVTVEQDGEVVRHLNAEINLPNVLATVFSTTSRDRGELPFAVADDGRIFTRGEDDRARVESFGEVAKPGGPAMARLNDWIVVTTQDPSGSGLRLGIARPVGDSLTNLRRTAARNAGMGLLFIAVALVGIVPLSTRLTRNLSTLGDGVRRIAQGDYRARVPVLAKDEVGQLAMAFNQMAEDVERHQQSAVEQERIRRELELGRQIQNEMLPHAPLRLGLTEIEGVSVPAREVGGDFFNYFVLSNGQVALLVGDVSGKGVGAALLMANIQASLRTRLAMGQDLSALAEEIDRDIEDNSPGPVYATLFVAILDPATRQLRYVNAGHHPQYVLRNGGGLERMSSSGLPVGLLAGRGYQERHVQLHAGDLLFFYTDGCVEAENETGEMFSTERLEELLQSTPIAGATDALRQVEDTVAAFRGKREPFDDATMMTVRVG